MEMNLLFWNLHKNNIENFIADIIAENDVDVAIFAEYMQNNFNDVFDRLGNSYYKCENLPDAKTILVCKNAIRTESKRDQARYSFFTVSVENTSYIVGGVHLTSAFNGQDLKRLKEGRNLASDLRALENEEGHTNSIIVGDFNASPFDSVMTITEGINAVLFKEIIEDNEFAIVDHQRFRRLYNPTFHYLSEMGNNYGSIFYKGQMDTLYWYSFDQVLVRKGLANAITSVRYCRQIGRNTLLHGIYPRDSISDHLPLLVNIMED